MHKSKNRSKKNQKSGPRATDNRTRNGMSLSLQRPGPVPKRVRKTFTYDKVIGIGGVSSFQVYDFRLNSIFAVDATVGDPAVGEAAWTEMYGSYKVMRGRMKYEFVSSSTTANQGIGFTFKDYQPSTNITTFLQAEHALSTTFATGINVVGLASGASRYISPWYHFNPAAILGEPKEYVSDRDFAGLMGVGNPNQILWASFIALNNVTSTTSGTLVVNFEFVTDLWSVSQNLL